MGPDTCNPNCVIEYTSDTDNSKCATRCERLNEFDAGSSLRRTCNNTQNEQKTCYTSKSFIQLIIFKSILDVKSNYHACLSMVYTLRTAFTNTKQAKLMLRGPLNLF